MSKGNKGRGRRGGGSGGCWASAGLGSLCPCVCNVPHKTYSP